MITPTPGTCDWVDCTLEMRNLKSERTTEATGGAEWEGPTSNKALVESP